MGDPSAYRRELVRSQIPTDPAEVGIPKLRLPFDMDRTGDKVRAGTYQQGSPDDLVQNVWVVLATDLGSRDELPDFGNPDQTFTTEFDIEAVREAIETWEPRAVHMEDSELANLVQTIFVEVG